MIWNSDAFFAIGKTHMVCQDYARAGKIALKHNRPISDPSSVWHNYDLREQRQVYAVLSDGCSSSPDTDFGARLLVAATESSLRGNSRSILAQASAAAYDLNLPPHCLDATLLTARYGETEEGDPGVSVSLRGDGVVAARRRDGLFYFYQVEHPRGAPFYLSYDMELERGDAYREEYGEESVCRVYYSGFAEHRSRDGWIPEATEKISRHGDWFFRSAEYNLVMLFSDGVTSFQRAVETNTSLSFKAVPVEEVVAQVLAIKGFAGSFVQRRCHKFLTKFCAQEGWHHTDDFSAAAIWMGESNDAR
jgi:hypothetical protein